MSLDGGSSYPIVLTNSTAADGRHSVNVQAAWATATARVRITWVENGGISDTSATNFGIH